MKVLFNNEKREVEEIEKDKITIRLNKNIDYHISINKFEELVINKMQFGKGEGSIVLKPSVSNEIRLT